VHIRLAPIAHAFRKDRLQSCFLVVGEGNFVIGVIEELAIADGEAPTAATGDHRPGDRVVDQCQLGAACAGRDLHNILTQRQTIEQRPIGELSLLEIRGTNMAG